MDLVMCVKEIQRDSRRKAGKITQRGKASNWEEDRELERCGGREAKCRGWEQGGEQE